MELSMKMISALPAVLLAMLLIAAVWGKIASNLTPCPPDVTVEFLAGEIQNRLYVMVPGMLGSDGQRKHWRKIAAELRKRGDVAMIAYPASARSNADASQIAQRISELVQHTSEQKKYQHIVLVGNSMGALLARKSFLFSEGAAHEQKWRSPDPWSRQVRRLVLLAGMNRGWDLSGEKPADMRWYVYYLYSVGFWFANLTNSGQLALQMQAGAPFVANLRLEWMRWARAEERSLEAVQLLGDIDEIVRASDNEDLRVSAAGKFTWIKVRGTGHADILNIDEPEQGLGRYRLNKFIEAIDSPFAQLQHQSEELPYGTDVTSFEIPGSPVC
jgi:pimeloyl-ACP methyl ester carboxylesterase